MTRRTASGTTSRRRTRPSGPWARPARIAENFDIFDFELSGEHIAAIDTLDSGVRGGPDPDSITLEAYGVEIPEA